VSTDPDYLPCPCGQAAIHRRDFIGWLRENASQEARMAAQVVTKRRLAFGGSSMRRTEDGGIVMERLPDRTTGGLEGEGPESTVHPVLDGGGGGS